MSILLDVLKKPKILQPKKHILLLSHMRAYTSLFGHILGNHSQIDGYYEMHIGYYSWKSLIRQKSLYYKDHKISPCSTYIFDKILHNEHYVSPQLLTRNNVIPLFSIREPSETIPSIVALYNKVNPKHDFCNIEFAAEYYTNRLKYLVDLSIKIKKQYYYIDADCVVGNTEDSLKELSKILGLSTTLQPQYKKMPKTGVGATGDHSTELLSGTIQKKKKQNKLILPQNLLIKLETLYSESRALLISNSQSIILSNSNEN
tara:strand:+ start:3408 stop:4184 length:777 start_codon:yes stop_codon:yes gene_type:complete